MTFAQVIAIGKAAKEKEEGGKAVPLFMAKQPESQSEQAEKAYGKWLRLKHGT